LLVIVFSSRYFGKKKKQPRNEDIHTTEGEMKKKGGDEWECN